MAEQAESVPAQCVGDIEYVADRGSRGVAGTRRQVRAVTVAGQIDGNQLQRRQVRRQRHEAGGVVEPAMQGQHAWAAAVVAQAGDACAPDLEFKRLQAHASEDTASRARARACSGSALRQGM